MNNKMKLASFSMVCHRLKTLYDLGQHSQFLIFITFTLFRLNYEQKIAVMSLIALTIVFVRFKL